MTAEVRVPSQDCVRWTDEMAATAIGKPFIDQPVDGAQIGEVVRAEVVDGELVLFIEIDRGGIVGFDLATEEVQCVSLGLPIPRVVDDSEPA